MPITAVNTPDGSTLNVEHPEDASELDILRFAELQYEEMNKPEQTVIGTGGEIIKGFGRGFGKGLLSAGAGLAELADVATDAVGLEGLIDSGDENMLINAANQGKDALDEYMGVGDAYKDSYLVGLSEGLGSIGSFFIPGLGAAGAAGRLGATAATASKIGKAATVSAGVGSGADEQAERIRAARERGIEISDRKEDLSIFLGGAVGTLESITPLSALKKIRGIKEPEKIVEGLQKKLDDAVQAGDEVAIARARNELFTEARKLNQIMSRYDRLKSAGQQGSVEGIQEAVSGLLQDGIQYGLYDETVAVGDSMWDDFTIGAPAGAILDAFATGLTNKKRRAIRNVEEQKEQLIRNELDKRRAEYLEDAEIYKLQFEQRDRLAAIDEATRLQEEAQKVEQEPFNPEQPYRPKTRQNLTLAEQAAEYANQISRDALRRDNVFPDGGAFTFREIKLGPEGSRFEVYSTQDGKVYGEPSRDYEFAAHLTSSLNKELVNRNINRAILDSMDLSPELYTPEQAENIYIIGQKLNRPNIYKINSAVLNQAAGTVSSATSPFQEDKTIDQLHVEQYGVPPFTDRGEKLYKPLSNLTASQEVNLERKKKGLSEIDEFTLDEAKQILGDKYSNVFDVLLGIKQPDDAEVLSDFGTVGKKVAQSRQEYQDERSSRAELEKALVDKNIMSGIDSPEVKYISQRIVGEQGMDNMSPSQRMYLVEEIKKFPRLPQKTRIPNFTPKRYTKRLYDIVTEHVIAMEDGSPANIESIISEIDSDRLFPLIKRRLDEIRDEPFPTYEISEEISKDLISSGLVNKDFTVNVKPDLPAIESGERQTRIEDQFDDIPDIPYKEPELLFDPVTKMPIAQEAKLFEQNLQDEMNAIGLGDVGVRVMDALRLGPVTREGEIILTGDPRETTDVPLGYYLPSVRRIFLAMDVANELSRDASPESKKAALDQILNHETVHAVRDLDLWEESEWSLLENAAKKKMRKDDPNKSYFIEAKERYKTDGRGRPMSPVSQMEEAVAELIKDARKDNKFISGKPKSLINRFYNFIDRASSAIRGTGFQSFEDIVQRLESGEIGKRERGKIRTLQQTERLVGAVPERGIGLPSDERSLEETIPGQQPAQARRKSTTPIESTIKLATTKYNDYNTAVEEEFFGKFWPSMLAEIKGTVSTDKIGTAAKRALNDVSDFIADNPKYKDYYEADMQGVRQALDSKYGEITDDELRLYQVFNGLNSAQTSLPANVGDALNVFELYKDKGNLDDIKMGVNENGNVVIKSSPFKISGASSPNKARALKVFERLINLNSNEPEPVKSAVDFLSEGVTVKELQAFNRKMGYKSNVSDIGAIRSLVKQATGQDKLIPRMFIFGKKVGAYTLNLTGDTRFTTIDVWESRFIRSYFEDQFKKNTGLPVTVDEDALFQDFSRRFKKEFDKKYEMDADPAALQAMRWFYMINAAKKSGYKGASTNETISEITDRYISRDGVGRDASRGRSDEAIDREVQEDTRESRLSRADQEIISARRKEADQIAEDFKDRESDPIMRAANRNPETLNSIVNQDMVGQGPFPWQSGSYFLRGADYTKGDKFIYQVQDKFIGLKNLIDGLNRARVEKGLPEVRDQDNPYVGEETVAGKIGALAKDFDLNKKRPLAQKIAESEIPLEEVDEFLVLRHAIERNNMLKLRDRRLDVEESPGAGSLKTGERLSNSFVKGRMADKYGLLWNDASETWTGGNARAEKLLSIAKDLDQINKETMDRNVEYGLIDRESADSIMDMFKYYTPLRGKDMEDDVAQDIVIGSSYSTKGPETMAAMGRESAAESSLGHTLLNAERSISRGIKNQNVGQRLIKLIKDNPNPDFWSVIAPGDSEVTSQLERKYTYVGKDPDLQGTQVTKIPAGANRKDYIKQVVDRVNNLAGALDPNTVGAKIDGEQYYVKLSDKRLEKALLSMNASDAQQLIQKFGVVNRWLSMVNTSLNPEFVIGNFSRDVQTAINNLLGEQNMSKGKAKDQKLISTVLKDVIPSMGAFYKGLRRYDIKTGTFRDLVETDAMKAAGEFFTRISPKDMEDFKEFIGSGAKADWFHTRPPEDQFKTIQSMVDMANGTFTGNFKKRRDAIFNFVEDSNSAVENAVRFATFKASRDQLLEAGIPRDVAVARAASLAKNLTINFNRKGMSGDLINSLYLFFNASVQGTANFARGLFGPKGNPFSKEASRVKQGAVTGLIALGAINAMRAEEESEEDPISGRSYYSDIEDFVKERNIIIMKDNGREYYSIPLPYGYNVFHVLGQNLYEMSQGLISAEKATSNFLAAFTSSFSPVGASAVSVAPTVAQPFIELGLNRNFWGGPIYRESFPGEPEYPDSALARASTGAIFKQTASFLNELTRGNSNESGFIDVSPETLQHLTQFIVGGAGTFGLRNFNALEKWANSEDLELREIPFVRRIMGEPSQMAAMEDFYERRTKITQKNRQYNSLRGKERIDYNKQNKNYQDFKYILDDTEREIKRIRAEIRSLREEASDSPLNAREFALKEEAAYDKINEEYAKFNKRYDKKIGRTN